MAVGHRARSWLSSRLRKTPGKAIPLRDFLAIAYGDEFARIGIADIRARLGKDRIETIGDMRNVSMMLDRQAHPTPLSVSFSSQDFEFCEINGVSCPIDRHDWSVSAPWAAVGHYEPHDCCTAQK